MAAKELLLRYGYEDDFERINLKVRELGFAVDTDKLYIGTSQGNAHIPNFIEVTNKIKEMIKNRRIKFGDEAYINSNLLPAQMGFNTTKHRIEVIDPTTNIRQTYITKADHLLNVPKTIKLSDDDIDHDDNDSITLTDFTRPIIMVFLNGALVTDHSDDPHTYSYDTDKKELKVTGCSDGDLLSFY